MNKKILLFLLFLVFIVGTSISSVNAIPLEQQTEAKQLLSKSPMDDLKDGEILILSSGSVDGYDYKYVRVKLNQTYLDGGAPVKKDGKYQKKWRVNNKVRIFDVIFEKQLNNQYEYLDFKLNSTNQKVVAYKYTLMKKGEWFNIYSSSTKKEYKKGKISKVTYDTGLRVVNSKKVKKVTAVTEKKVIGYYKTFKMPTFKQGKYKWGTFKGNSFTYGNSYVGYYVNHLKEYAYYNSNHRIYKVSPKTWDLYGTNMFYKKPKSFTLYAYA